MVEGTVVGREGSQAAVPLVGVAVVVKGSLRNHAAVSYTHLTLPTNSRV